MSLSQTICESREILHHVNISRYTGDISTLISTPLDMHMHTCRHLLRFSSLTNNWGTADFRPYQDRNQWQWHACHAHFHSFEAFVHYDLLNKSSGVKVAEGHKASFCLEDSRCATGPSRYACMHIYGIPYS